MTFDDHFEELACWLTAAGLAGESEIALVTGFCNRVVALGLPLARAQVFIDTLHPIHEGRLFRWSHDAAEPVLVEYGRTGQVGASGAAAPDPQQAEASEPWRQSPFYRILQTGESLLLRRRLSAETKAGFSALPDMQADGMTDYVASDHGFTEML